MLQPQIVGICILFGGICTTVPLGARLARIHGVVTVGARGIEPMRSVEPDTDSKEADLASTLRTCLTLADAAQKSLSRQRTEFYLERAFEVCDQLFQCSPRQCPFSKFVSEDEPE